MFLGIKKNLFLQPRQMKVENYSLLTDLYQLTMGYAYWKNQKHEQNAVFNLYYRKSPFGGEYTVVAGLQTVIDFIQHFRIDDSDLAYLRTLKGNDGKPLFEEDYLKYLSELRFSGDVYAIEEGDIAFPNLPLIQLRAPLIQAQILETPLLAIVNFQTLIATKASRVVQAAQGDKVLEFGLRRAQGIDGALSASRAAYIGGVDGTSNVLAGKLWNIPVKGTHAHAWVMVFPSELEAFEAYANTMANNCIFLVDTYDTIQGVKNAIKIGKKLKEKGFNLAGIRLDSGNLTTLSIEARKLLDEAGFVHTSIVASNDLDEDIIYEMKKNGAQIDVWAVGTHLVTAHNQPALGGVYKLAAIQENNQWKYRIKLSEQIIKISTPGILEPQRILNSQNQAIADVLIDILQPHSNEFIHEKTNNNFQMKPEYHSITLLKKIFENGKLIYPTKTLEEIRHFHKERKNLFPPQLFDLHHPCSYPIYLEKNLFTLKSQMVKK